MKYKITFIAVVLTLALSAAPDAGAQWEHVGLANRNVQTLAVNGANIFAGTLDSGLWLSTDNGVSWKSVSAGLKYNFIEAGNDTLNLALDVTALMISGTNIFAGTNGGGIFYSKDNAATWTNISKGLPGDYPTIETIEAMGGALFTSTAGGEYLANHIFRSTDSGTNWMEKDSGSIINSPTYDFALMGSMIFAGTQNYGVFLSTDSGTSWTSTNQSAYPDVYSLAVSGTNLFAGTLIDYVFLSTDSGASWVNAYAGLPSDRYGYVKSFAVNGSNLFAGTYGNDGHGHGIFLSTDSGLTWVPENTGFRSEGLVYSIKISGSNLFAGTDSGVWRRPLSQMIGSSSVAQNPSAQSSIAAYPNPFTQTTTLHFTTPESGAAEVTIVNALGKEVSRIFDGEMNAGQHSFTWDANGMAPGTYWCIVRMNGQTDRIPIVLQR